MYVPTYTEVSVMLPYLQFLSNYVVLNPKFEVGYVLRV